MFDASDHSVGLIAAVSDHSVVERGPAQLLVAAGHYRAVWLDESGWRGACGIFTYPKL